MTTRCGPHHRYPNRRVIAYTNLEFVYRHERAIALRLFAGVEMPDRLLLLMMRELGLRPSLTPFAYGARAVKLQKDQFYARSHFGLSSSA